MTMPSSSWQEADPLVAIYLLSVKKTQTMDEYIEEALSQGYIHPLMSPVSEGFLSLEKKGGGLQSCKKYRDLNQVTVNSISLIHHWPRRVFMDQDKVTAITNLPIPTTIKDL